MSMTEPTLELVAGDLEALIRVTQPDAPSGGPGAAAQAGPEPRSGGSGAVDPDASPTADPPGTPVGSSAAGDREPVPAAVTHPLGGAFLGDPASLRDMRPSTVHQPTGLSVRRRHDFECEAFAVGGLHVAGASLRGLSHSWDGRPNQDAFFVGMSEDQRWVIAVVADGVSAAALAADAAEASSREAWRAVRHALSASTDPREIDWAAVGETVRQRVLARGRRLVAALSGDASAGQELPAEAVAEHFASTTEVVLVEVAPDADGARRVVRLALAGDSTCAVLDQSDAENPSWTIWSAGKDPDAAVTSNAVRPLPLPQPELVATWGQLLPRQVLALVTDGIGDPLADGTTLTGAHLALRWGTPLAAVKFLDSCAFVVAGGEDDRTAVAVWA